MKSSDRYLEKEVSIIELKNGLCKRFKVTKIIPSLSVAEN